MDVLGTVSSLCGWVYTLAWSLSFYPQPTLNARRRSTSGTTIDFPFINTLGFLAYLLSNLALRYSATVRGEYAARHHGLAPTGAFNDVAFASHAFVLSLVTVSQYFLPTWWRIAAGPGSGVSRRPSRFILFVAAGSVTVIGGLVAVVLYEHSGSAVGSPAGAWAWLDVVYALGYVKLVITLIKYSPQLLANWRNRSTHGWSIVQIILDSVGGVLSIVQLLLDSYSQGDWSGLTGNPVKLLLGNVSIFYDILFIVQHFVLYKSSGSDGDDGDGADGLDSGRAAVTGSTSERDPLL
ncbi:lysosomal cystine transporter [Grosmannia clavigera kw1407]|uniref:Lysosomal cystine transporter n=1 Tax=Grosmannia clavigera (strain kw1407 / UAMH 11150) TaxID=655863 RepID=F0XLM7_GROCL|nr:lysosomal cystine transporter [Grosmannia clavigera kw1407]EFX01541.1 lysosomal cystine transporter [Grosmannia clavigera kw1407]